MTYGAKQVSILESTASTKKVSTVILRLIVRFLTRKFTPYSWRLCEIVHFFTVFVTPLRNCAFFLFFWLVVLADVFQSRSAFWGLHFRRISEQIQIGPLPLKFLPT